MGMHHRNRRRISPGQQAIDREHVLKAVGYGDPVPRAILDRLKTEDRLEYERALREKKKKHGLD